MTKNFLDAIILGDTLDPDQISNCMKEYHNTHVDWSEQYFSRPSEFGETSYELLSRSLEIPSQGPVSILDLGCGIGTFYKLLPDGLRSRISYSGIDISEKCVESAKNRFAGESACFSVASAANLSFGNESFDAVVSHMAFSMFKPIRAAASEAVRVLRKGGSFSVIFPAVWTASRNQNQALSSGIREIVKSVYPNFEKNRGGIGEVEFFSKDNVRSFISEFPEISIVDINEFEVDFSGALNEVLWGIKTFYWFQILDDASKFVVEKKLIELLKENQESEGNIRNGRRFALLKCRRN